ncbi:MAG: hypothetical protein IKN04_13685, partial [Clostridia bacterium]|nr:hypothetical protein [Clostridia bacterium]
GLCPSGLYSHTACIMQAGILLETHSNKKKKSDKLSSHQGLLEVFCNKLEEPKLNRLRFVPVHASSM